MPAFAQYVAVDWSGAKGLHHKSIAVARAIEGDAAPQLVSPPTPKGWSRTGVLAWLLAQDVPTCVGFDFSFAPPFLDRGSYCPGVETASNAPAFWAYLDRFCRDPDLAGHSFIEGPARAHFWLGAADGPKADFLRWRLCETRFNQQASGTTASLFECVGAAQVGKASLAGMRLLHHLQAKYRVWPFQTKGPFCAVEIYTRRMLQIAGGRGQKLRDLASLKAALAHVGSRTDVALTAPFSDHESDALVAVAALRQMAVQPHWWNPSNLPIEAFETEGWTFGIA